MGNPRDIVQWRKAQRTELLAARMALPAAERRRHNARITRLLVEGFPILHGMLLGFYRPFHGEFDPTTAIRFLRKCGTRSMLPAVVQRKQPLQFREWWPGAPMTTDECGLPIPDATEVIRPEALLIPQVGFDAQGYRLGYGGGYFDRTLATFQVQPLKIGVAFELSRIPTVYPQPHDVPMDFIVTDAGVHHVADGKLDPVETAGRAFELACEIVWRRERDAQEASSPPDRKTQCNGIVAGEYSSPPCLAHEIDPYYWDQ